MHSLKEIIIPYSFYDKNWDIVTDTMENNLVIKNSFVNVKVNITIINYCSTDSSYTILNLFVDDSLFYTIDLGKSSEIKALYYAQDFLFENHLLLYVDGFGTASFDDKIYIEQSKPTKNYESGINNKSNDR